MVVKLFQIIGDGFFLLLFSNNSLNACFPRIFLVLGFQQFVHALCLLENDFFPLMLWNIWNLSKKICEISNQFFLYKTAVFFRIYSPLLSPHEINHKFFGKIRGCFLIFYNNFFLIFLKYSFQSSKYCIYPQIFQICSSFFYSFWKLNFFFLLFSL